MSIICIYSIIFHLVSFINLSAQSTAGTKVLMVLMEDDPMVMMELRSLRRVY